MPIEFTLPDLGENISSAGVLAVLVKAGDEVKIDTPILEIETDKATIEVPSDVTGKITEVLVKPGDKATPGQVVLKLEGSEAAAESKPAAEKSGEASSQAAPSGGATAGDWNQAAAADAGASSGGGAQASAPQPSGGDAQASKPSGGGPQEVKLPDLGENIASANILSVLLKEGDKVTSETGMLELETDKATVEVPAGVDGTVSKVHVKAGDTAKPGQVILTVQGSSGGSAEAKPAASASAAAHSESKASQPAAVAPAAAPKPTTNGSAAKAPAPTVSRAPGKPVPASPTVRRLAREIGVDISSVRGSGPRGRISHDDVKAHARGLLKQAPGGSASAGGGFYRPMQPVLPDFSRFGQTEREAMSGIRKKTAEQMGMAWSTIPMVTQFDKADVTDLEKLRQQLDAKTRKAGGPKLTVTAILMKVCTSALKKFPKFNASIDLSKEEVVFKKYFNMGVAVDTERGLLVPVIKNIDRMNIMEISEAMTAIAEKARNRKVTPDDLQGSNFTITNLGGIGGTSFTPIVNPPEVAILGVSRTQTEPVWQNDSFVPRQMLPLSLSYDHRLIDGAEAARFLRFVCEALANPALLLFEG